MLHTEIAGVELRRADMSLLQGWSIDTQCEVMRAL